MATVHEIAECMQTVLKDEAERLGRETGFVQRKSKMMGAEFAQTLVFGWMSNPDATLGELCQAGAAVDVDVSCQGLDQRFSQSAATFLKALLDRAVEEMVVSDPVAIPLLERFEGVYLLDSSTVVLPDEVRDIWPGCGGRVETNAQASTKLQVCLDLTRGRVRGPLLQSGRSQDRTSPFQNAPLPRGALRLADLGYFSLDVMDTLNEAGVYWLSRIQTRTSIVDAERRVWVLSEFLQAHEGQAIDVPIRLGAKKRVPCRLLAVTVPQEVADRRRQRLHEQARRKGQAVSKEHLTLADWTILVTNAPQQLLTLAESLVLSRARWQIELLFKLWKSHGAIARSRSDKPWRILCELYAKLLAMLVKHWALLVRFWRRPHRSLTKACQTIQHHALNLACASRRGTRQLTEALEDVVNCLSAGCRMNKRKKNPNTHQLLLSPPKVGLG